MAIAREIVNQSPKVRLEEVRFETGEVGVCVCFEPFVGGKTATLSMLEAEVWAKLLHDAAQQLKTPPAPSS